MKNVLLASCFALIAATISSCAWVFGSDSDYRLKNPQTGQFAVCRVHSKTGGMLGMQQTDALNNCIDKCKANGFTISEGWESSEMPHLFDSPSLVTVPTECHAN